MVIGVALREIASVNCSVKANPVNGLRFLWTFNSSSELNYLPDSRFTQDGTTSQVKIKISHTDPLTVVNAAINVFSAVIFGHYNGGLFIFAIKAIIRIMPALQQNLTFRITFYTGKY